MISYIKHRSKESQEIKGCYLIQIVRDLDLIAMQLWQQIGIQQQLGDLVVRRDQAMVVAMVVSRDQEIVGSTILFNRFL